MTTEIAIEKIKVGTRIRKSLEGIAGLVDSIQEVGLLHPVVINKRRELIAGGRRLEAAKSMGWKTIPVRIIATLNDAVLAIKAEHDENANRVPLKPSEMGEFGRRLEELEKEAAKKRKGVGRPKAELSSGKFPEDNSKGEVRDKVGEALGVSGKTYEKIKVIAEDAVDELKEMVDAGEVSVSAAAKVAELPTEEQAKIVANGADAVKQAAKAKPAEESPDLVKQMETVCRELDQLKATVEAWKDNPESHGIHFPTVVEGIVRIRKDIWGARPAYPCPYCEAKGAKADCKACKGTQKVVKHIKESGTASMNRYGGTA